MSRDTGTYGGGEAWDGGPPGAEADYAYSGYAAPSAYKYGSGAAPYPSDSRYASYESSHYPGYSMQYPAGGSSHYPPPPPPPAERYVEHKAQHRRRSPSRSPVDSRSYDAKRRRSRSSSDPRERRRRTRSPDRPSRHRRTRSPSTPPRLSRSHRSRSSTSSDASSPRPSPPRRKSPPRRRIEKSPSQNEKKKLVSKRDKSRHSRESREKEHSKSRHGDRTPERATQRRRERSFTPPRSYKPRASSSSSSASSRSASRSHSHSTSRSRSPARRSSASRSPSPHTPRQKELSRSKSRSSDNNTDSDTSSRGRFSGYDRKRYFRNLKEKQAKEQLLKDQEKENTGSGEAAEVSAPPPGAVEPTSVDVDSVQYGDPPPVEGINFEDLPPPPEELFSRPGPARRQGTGSVCIRNDGSFLEMFKRMQEETKRAEAASGVMAAAEAPVRKPALPFIGKRRGGRVLKTGIVKKVKAPVEPTEAAPKDAWSLYMQEVKKYRETSCEEERKTRPLVK